MPDNRSKTGTFVKGQSGNPNGRPKTDPDIKAMLKAASKEAAQLLIDTLQDEAVKIEVRKSCAETILDRVYGKATQPMDVEGNTTIEILLQGASRNYAE